MKLTCDLSVTSSFGHRPLASVPWDLAWFSPNSATPPALLLEFITDNFGRGGVQETLGAVMNHTRASDATYFNALGAMVTAAADVPRFDHDPSGPLPVGLLTERAGSNLIVNSDAPAGQNVTVTNVAHVLSFYGTGTVDLTGAHVETIVGSGAFPTRTKVTFTPSAGTLTIAFSGTVVSPQLEEANEPTSYIASGASAGTRAGDNASVALGTWFSGTQGTLVFSGSLRDAVANDRLVEIDDGSSSSRVSILWNTVLNKPQLQVWDSGSLQAAILPDGSALALGDTFRVAIAFSANDFAISLNGGTVATDTSGTVAAGLSFLRIGRAAGGGQCNLATESVVYYDQRLSDAELQALSA